MEYLIHYLKYPPGYDGLVAQGEKALSPMSTDLSAEMLSKISQRAKEIYGGRDFVYLIPEESVPFWEKSGQLGSLFDMIVKMDWAGNSVEKLVIDASQLDLSSALVRETFFISPESLGSEDFKVKQDKYIKAYVEMAESVQSFKDYKNDFKNPEILMPSEIKFELVVHRELVELVLKD
jgi:hypothetical protein